MKREDQEMAHKKKQAAVQAATECKYPDLPTHYYKNFYEWPKQWIGFGEDLNVGNRIIKEYLPFIEHLVGRQLARSTIKKYMSDLGVLGSEIISRIHLYEDQRNWSAKQILLFYIDDSGGPFPHCWNPDKFIQQRYISAYNSVCRQLYKYLSACNGK